jgi:NAD(P)-dependent dehydrogenase (short-subunit alcohol dehydrogenase family)
MSVVDRLAIVTGTSSGVGAALARLLIARGWCVLGLSRREAGLQSGRYRHAVVDLAALERVCEVARETLEPMLRERAWRRVGLVNNAGAIGALRALEDADAQALAAVFAVNALAPMLLMGCVARASPAVPLRIVNVSTGAALQPIPGIGDYGASKAALRLASMTFAAELSSPERDGGARADVRVLSYAPGVVDTPMQQAARAPRAWNRLFVDFQARGQLVPPQGPAGEIADFLDAGSGPVFEERRFGGVT